MMIDEQLARHLAGSDVGTEKPWDQLSQEIRGDYIKEARYAREFLARLAHSHPGEAAGATFSAAPSAAGQWAEVELFRWQYGEPPLGGDTRPLDRAAGLRNMADALDRACGSQRNADAMLSMPDPFTIGAILRHVALVLDHPLSSTGFTGGRDHNKYKHQPPPMAFDLLIPEKPRQTLRCSHRAGGEKGASFFSFTLSKDILRRSGIEVKGYVTLSVDRELKRARFTKATAEDRGALPVVAGGVDCGRVILPDSEYLGDVAMMFAEQAEILCVNLEGVVFQLRDLSPDAAK